MRQPLQPGPAKTICLWDITTGKQLRELPGHLDGTKWLAFSPNGETLASAGKGIQGHHISLWNVATGEERLLLRGDKYYPFLSIAFSLDGKMLAWGGGYYPVHLWDVSAQKEIAALWHPGVISGVAFSPDSKTLASSANAWDSSVVVLWDVAEQKQIATFEGHTDHVSSVSFSPDGKLLASGSWDGTILLWQLDPSSPFVVEPKGKRFITLGELKRTMLLQNFPNPFNPETWIPYYLAEDSPVTIRIYNAQGELIRKLDLGKQPAGGYLTREKAAYWDGKNDSGESVTSGVYLYELRAGNYRGERKTVLMK